MFKSQWKNLKRTEARFSIFWVLNILKSLILYAAGDPKHIWSEFKIEHLLTDYENTPTGRIYKNPLKDFQKQFFYDTNSVVR